MPREDRGFLPIGSLLPKIVSSPAPRDSTTDSSGTPSATTGTRLPAPARSSGTGPRLGGTGVASRPAWTPNADPERANELLWDSARQRLPSSAGIARRAIYDPDFDCYDLIVPRSAPTAADLAALDAIEAELEPWLEPTPRATAVKVIQALRQRTAGRTPDEGDTLLMLDEYARAFADYPEDVLREAARRWSRRERWFPAEADLRAECDRLMAPRRRLAEGLRAARRGPAAEETPAELPPKRYSDLTPEERAAHDELIRSFKASLGNMAATPMPASAKALAYDLARKAAGASASGPDGPV